MANGDYFFLIFLGTIALTRLLLLSKKGSPTIREFRLRHYMYGIVLIVFSFLTRSITTYAIGFGLFVDEVPLILIKGPGHREKYWRGIEDYFSPWCVSGVLILIFVAYIFRDILIKIF